MRKRAVLFLESVGASAATFRLSGTERSLPLTGVSAPLSDGLGEDLPAYRVQFSPSAMASKRRALTKDTGHRTG